MAATNGTAQFIGLRTRQTYTKDLYLSDAAGALVNWDSGAGASATSEQSWIAPEPVVLSDVAVVTGAAQTKLQLLRNGVPSGDMLRQTVHLTTLANRPSLSILFTKGDKIGMIQIA